jgi:hypothetical protein
MLSSGYVLFVFEVRHISLFTIWLLQRNYNLRVQVTRVKCEFT